MCSIGGGNSTTSTLNTFTYSVYAGELLWIILEANKQLDDAEVPLFLPVIYTITKVN